MSRLCPRCGEALTERAFGHVSIDGCPACGGLWLDHNELNALTRDPQVGLMEVERAFQKSFAARESGGKMACPNCAAPLAPFSFPHSPDIPLDACFQCKGIWLDDGEMQAIADRVASLRPRPVAAPAPEEQPRHQIRSVAGFLLSVVCPHCQTTNPAASLSCWACGKALKSRNVLLLCPRCDRPLSEVRHETARADVCALCTGVWFEEGELPVFLSFGLPVVQEIQARTLAQKPLDAAPRARPLTTHCPGCHYEMEPRAFGGSEAMLVELCSHCQSLWLDAGELTAIYDMTQRGGSLNIGSARVDPWGND